MNPSCLQSLSAARSPIKWAANPLSDLDSEFTWTPAAQLRVNRRPARDPDLESLWRPSPWPPFRLSTPQPIIRRDHSLKRNTIGINNKSAESTRHEIDFQPNSPRSESLVPTVVDTDGLEPVPEREPGTHHAFHRVHVGVKQALLQKLSGSYGIDLGTRQKKSCVNGGFGSDSERNGSVQALLKSWRAVCKEKSHNQTIVVPKEKTCLLKLVRVEGPCVAPYIRGKILGNIVAPSNPWSSDGANWIAFFHVNGLAVYGKGKKWWKSCQKVCNILISLICYIPLDWEADEDELDIPTRERGVRETGFIIAGGPEEPSGKDEGEVGGEHVQAQARAEKVKIALVEPGIMPPGSHLIDEEPRGEVPALQATADQPRQEE